MKFSLYILTLLCSPLLAFEMRSLPDFNEISAGTGVQVILTKSNETRANVEVENCAQNDVITEVRGSRLIVKFEDKTVWNRSGKNRKAIVTVYYKDLVSIHVSSGATIKATNAIAATNLDLNGSSGGIMELDIRSTELIVGVSSGGMLKINGSTVVLKVDVSSGGVLKAAELESDHAYADASSGGAASFKVSKNLEADASSGGSIRYQGNPEKIRSNASSAGSIRVQTN